MNRNLFPVIIGILCLSFVFISCTNGDDLVEHIVTFDPANGEAIFTVKVEDGKKESNQTSGADKRRTYIYWLVCR